MNSAFWIKLGVELLRVLVSAFGGAELVHSGLLG